MFREIGIIHPCGFKNGCCEDKPFALTVNPINEKTSNFSCACQCGVGWVTSGHNNPAEAIMEYELMCRVYPDEVTFNDDKLFQKYKAYYVINEGNN